jgi:hypothetical protein
MNFKYKLYLIKHLQKLYKQKYSIGVFYFLTQLKYFILFLAKIFITLNVFTLFLPFNIQSIHNILDIIACIGF